MLSLKCWSAVVFTFLFVAAFLISGCVSSVYAKSVTAPILMYHYIGNNPNPADKARDSLSVTPDKFDAQLGYLASAGYTPITFDTLYAIISGAANPPAKPIILTFDDGYIDFYLNAYPILRKYGFRAVSFIPTGLANQGYYMSWDQIREIDRTGLVSFQAHTVNHPNLVGLSADKIKYQLLEGKKVLESQLGKPVNTIAYPYGISNTGTWNAAKAAGFIGGVGTYSGTTLPGGNILNMPRIKIPGSISLEDFKKRV